MHVEHDVEAIILMAVTLASKRRPATLVEIIAAADLIHGSIPRVEKLDEAIRRLSARGLIGAAEDGFMLTANGNALMARQPKKADTEQLLAAVESALAALGRGENAAPVVLGAEQLVAAIQSHKAARKAPGKNLLMPKPKLDRHFKVEGRWRRVAATRPAKPRSRNATTENKP